jgi:hypothetical protein
MLLNGVDQNLQLPSHLRTWRIRLPGGVEFVQEFGQIRVLLVNSLEAQLIVEPPTE